MVRCMLPLGLFLQLSVFYVISVIGILKRFVIKGSISDSKPTSLLCFIYISKVGFAYLKHFHFADWSKMLYYYTVSQLHGGCYKLLIRIIGHLIFMSKYVHSLISYLLIWYFSLDSGQKTTTKEWSMLLEIKGKVRLDAFEKFVRELPNSRSRAVCFSAWNFTLIAWKLSTWLK